MIRFAMYALLLFGSAAGVVLIFYHRRTFSPRIMGLAAPLSITFVWGAFMVTTTILYWMDGCWLREPPVSSALAIANNGVGLSWVFTSLVILLDKIRQAHNG